ncbi:hypothetical protein J2Y48_004231 [Mycoplana sp. BE70]|uniref:hypothetical protein n=1 Tax=Mycoplana sp. BE70 TaxID=2817775 RepID=UPI00285B564C|nr:hypothetical protein [Mycoplana sp. BE70]MDR6758923.1 hypothetical protein [Mycoplana sp. BE70]
MSEPRSTLEARLNAHRRLLVMMLAMLSGDKKHHSALKAMLEENKFLANYEEDPGIDPGEAFAMQSCTNGEVSGIIEDAANRAKARL